MTLSLQLLGAFQITINEQPIPATRSKRNEAMLMFLAMEATRQYRRETLVGLFFPEITEETARVNLRQAITRLRRTIKNKEASPPYLISAGEITQFNQHSDFFLDVAAFRAALNGCDEHDGVRNKHCSNCLQKAREGIDLYQGPFLDGFYLENSVAFAEWVLRNRLLLQQEAVLALRQLATYNEQHGHYGYAERYARRLLQIEPWDEISQQQLMRVLAFQGKRNAALQQFQTFQQTVEAELGVDPLPETIALRDKIMAVTERRPRHLPPRDPNFIGRQDEMEYIITQLVGSKTQLLTLVGFGGIGKTRLAIETGWKITTHYLGPFMHGIYFVPLAGVAVNQTLMEEEVNNQVLIAIAESLHFSFSGTQSPQQQLVQYLKQKSLLLILDNCEHLLKSMRQLLPVLLGKATELKLLLTTRERLNLSGEWVLEIGGLPIEARQNTAVELFLRRAQQVDGSFRLHDGENENGRFPCTTRSVTQICQLLHGMPLAIELASPWVRMLTCLEIVREIEGNLDALTTTMADIPERHRSLRAVFEHSWQLLSEDEQQTLIRLSIFRGSFSRQAAKAVANAQLSQLTALLDKSLIKRIHNNSSRYQMQEVLRQFSTEKLAQQPEVETAVYLRHADYYLTAVAQQTIHLQTHQQERALAYITEAIENIRAAWQYALENEQAAKIDAAINALGLFYYIRSWFVEGAELFSRTATAYQKNDILKGKLLAHQGWLTFLLGEQSVAANLLQESAALLRASEKSADFAFSLIFLAVVTYRQGNFEEATQLCQEGLALSQANDDQYQIAIGNNVLSQIHFLQGNYEQSQQHCEMSLGIEQAIGNRWSMGFSLINLGRVAFAQEDFSQAGGYFQKSLDIRTEMRDARGRAICLNHLGDAALALDDFDEAKAQYQASLTIAREIGDVASITQSHVQLGHVNLAKEAAKAAKDAFFSALRQAPTVPLKLSALIGIAQLLISSDPVCAGHIVAMVQAHPASPIEAKETAVALKQQLPDQKPSAKSLDKLILLVLKT